MTFKGVVFNEMKGVYSSPDSANNRITQSALFPDNTYAVDSGGDPKAIPELSYDEFKLFHGRYYHPSNARFWFYGDDPPEERLRILDNYLSEFEAREVDSTVGVQPLFSVRLTATPLSDTMPRAEYLRSFSRCEVLCRRAAHLQLTENLPQVTNV